MTDSLRDPRLSREQLEALWAELHGRVRHLVGTDRADDIVQEAFLKALGRPLPGADGLSGWLRVLARNTAIRQHLRDDNRLRRERTVATGEGYWPAASGEVEAQLCEVQQALEMLPARYRAVLLLRYSEGLEIDEIARRLERPSGTVRSQIKRGLDRMRARLGHDRDRPRGLRAIVLLLRRPWSPPTWRALAVQLSAACAGVLVLAFWVFGGSDDVSSEVAALDRPPPEAVVRDELAVSAPPAEARRTRLETTAETPERTAAPETPGAFVPPLEWATSIHGLVLGPDGSPVAGADILVADKEAESGRVIAHSDAAGLFAVDAQDGREWIWAESEVRRPSMRQLMITSEPERPLTLVMGEALDACLGRLLTHDRQPVPEARVVIVGSMAPFSPKVTSQGTIECGYTHYLREVPLALDGTFRFGLGVYGGLALLVVPVEGTPAVFEARRQPPGTPYEFVLPRGGSVEGSVRSEDGRALTGIPLRLVLPFPLPTLEQWSDGRGEFRFENVPVGRHELRTGTEPGLGALSACLAGSLEDGESLRHELRLGAASVVSGVVRRDGRPLAGWSVDIERAQTDLFTDARRTSTTEDGRFAFSACLPGEEYVVRVRAPGSERVQGLARQTAGAATALEFEVREADWALCGLAGTLSAARPEDAPVFVELWSDALARQWMARVDPSTGRYAFDGLAPGSYTFRAWTRSIGALLLETQVLQPDRVLLYDAVLPEPGLLRIRLELPPDFDAERVDVVEFGPTMQGSKPYNTLSLQRGPGGREFSRVFQPGAHEVRVRIDKQIIETRTVSIESAQVAEETVTIPAVLVGVVLRLSTPRPIDEREGIELVLRGTSERTRPLYRSTAMDEHVFPVLVPLDTVEIEVRTEFGLRGTWKGHLDAGQEPPTLSIPLEEPMPPR